MTNRNRLIAFPLLLAVLCFIAPACTSQIKPPTPKVTIVYPPLYPTEIALEQNVSVSLDNAPLEEAIKSVTEKSCPNVLVEWDTLKNAGIDKNRLVTIHLTNVTRGHALAYVLDCGGTTPLDFDVVGNVLLISTHDALTANVRPYIEAYNVRDLVSAAGMFAPDSQTTTQPAPSPSPYNADITQIKNLLRSVDPTGWVDNGGSVGEIDDYHGILLIRNTHTNHRRIQQLLASLRKANDEYPMRR